MVLHAAGERLFQRFDLGFSEKPGKALVAWNFDEVVTGMMGSGRGGQLGDVSERFKRKRAQAKAPAFGCEVVPVGQDAASSEAAAGRSLDCTPKFGQLVKQLCPEVHSYETKANIHP